MFDTIWVGTETRDPDNQQWGRKTQYEAYFIMRWLGEIGGAKCGGGWFDPYGTSPATYVEQARQTVLGGAREALLFCYGSLRHQNGPANVETLRRELPQLFKLAELIRGREIRGVAAPKPPGSDADGNAFIYDFVGMLGLPLVPTAEVRADVPAAFLPIQALKDPKLAEKVEKMTAAGTPLLVTRQLADRLKPGELGTGNAEVLDVPKDAWALMDLSQERVRQIRKRMLTPLGVEFEAPTRMALYLFGDDLAVVENFNDRPVEVRLALREASRPTVVLAIPDTPASPPSPEDRQKTLIPARALVALRFGR
jgi:hypothetical protein